MIRVSWGVFRIRREFRRRFRGGSGGDLGGFFNEVSFELRIVDYRG